VRQTINHRIPRVKRSRVGSWYYYRYLMTANCSGNIRSQQSGQVLIELFPDGAKTPIESGIYRESVNVFVEQLARWLARRQVTLKPALLCGELVGIEREIHQQIIP
jgi:hypothetical protein